MKHLALPALGMMVAQDQAHAKIAGKLATTLATTKAELAAKAGLCERYSAVINALPKHQLSVVADALVAAHNGLRGDKLASLVDEAKQAEVKEIHALPFGPEYSARCFAKWQANTSIQAS